MGAFAIVGLVPKAPTASRFRGCRPVPLGRAGTAFTYRGLLSMFLLAFAGIPLTVDSSASSRGV